MDRRRYLALGASALAGIAGCSGTESDVDNPTTTATDRARGSAATDPPTDREDGATTATDTETRDRPTRETTDTDDGPTQERTETAAPLAGYETTTVRVQTPDGTGLGRVTAAIPATPEERYRGLGGVERLPPDRGMLFVFESVAERTFVMREMEIGIDIVFADADGTITRIHHAPAPGPGEDGNDQEYTGRGKYVLELAYRWTSTRGVTEGDVLAFDGA